MYERNTKPAPKSSTGLIIRGCVFGLLAILVIALFFGFFATISAGHVGVLTRFGATTGTELDPGFHLKLPFIENVADFNTQVQLVNSTSIEAASSDLQTVDTTVAVNFHPDLAHISDIYQQTGTDYATKILEPAVQESVKAVTAKYTASQLIGDRAQVKQDIDTLLISRVASFHIDIDAISVTNFTFSDSFNTAIEAKQVAQQAVLTAQQHLDQAKIDAQQQVVTAAAQAQARIDQANGQAQAEIINAKAASQAQSLQVKTLTPLYLQLLAINKWNGTLPQYSTVPTPFLSVGK